MRQLKTYFRESDSHISRVFPTPKYIHWGLWYHWLMQSILFCIAVPGTYTPRKWSETLGHCLHPSSSTPTNDCLSLVQSQIFLLIFLIMSPPGLHSVPRCILFCMHQSNISHHSGQMKASNLNRDEALHDILYPSMYKHS